MRVVMLQHQQHLLSGSGKGYEVIGQAALDQEGLQTMRALAHNMAWLLKATGSRFLEHKLKLFHKITPYSLNYLN